MSEMRRIMRDHDRHIQTIQEGGSIMQGLRGRISELESELTTLQSAHDKLKERVEGADKKWYNSIVQDILVGELDTDAVHEPEEWKMVALVELTPEEMENA
jgi:hypothetical protein